MSPVLSIAANLSPTTRQEIGIDALAGTIPITHLADKHQVSRKFVYQQSHKAQQALDELFAPSQGDDDVLFHLPVTKNWLYQLILGLVLICHSSYRGKVSRTSTARRQTLSFHPQAEESTAQSAQAAPRLCRGH